MIRPTKYTNLNICILRVAAAILLELRQAPAIALDELDTLVRSSVGEDARFNFMLALSFLYLIGQVEYDDSSDTIFQT